MCWPVAFLLVVLTGILSYFGNLDCQVDFPLHGEYLRRFELSMGGDDHCCVPGCHVNRRRVSNLISFHKLPEDDKRCARWLAVIPRDWKAEGIADPLLQLNRKTVFVCSRHFVNRKSDNPTDVDFIPTIFMEKSFPRPIPVKRTTVNSKRMAAETSLPEKRRKKVQTAPAATPCTPVWESDHDYTTTRTSTQTLSPDIKEKLLELERLKKENEELKCRLVTLETIMANPRACQRNTGLPSFTIFEGLSDYLWSRVEDGTFERFNKNPGPQRKLSFQQELFLVLSRLKTGKFSYDIAKQFGISEGLVSEIFGLWLNFLYAELKVLFELPDDQTVKEGAPSAFQRFDHVTMVIDCTEVFTQQPKSSTARKQVYSDYKSHNTAKFLVGMSPNMGVTFVSKAWGGRSSDSYITTNSDILLGSLHRGQKLMADKGFGTNMVTDQLRAQGVDLIMPSFKRRNRSQMSSEEIEKSEDCSMVRVHVERIIQRIKTWHILDREIMLNMQDITEQIFVVCSYLTNFQTSIVQEVV